MANDFNVLALVKGTEHYVFVYDEASRPQVVDAFREHADNPNLTLTYFDALVLTKKAREQAAESFSLSASPVPSPRWGDAAD